MKIKHIFSLAVLAVMTAACSSEDITQQPASSQIGQTLPFKATISYFAGTRGLTAPADDNSDITAKWEAGEKIALVHSTLDNENNPIVDVMTVDEVATDGKSATIAGKATYINDTENVYLVYVGHNDNMTTFQYYLGLALLDSPTDPIKDNIGRAFEAILAVTTQDGTLGTISNNLDFRLGTSKLKQTNGWATFSTDAPTLSSQFVIWKLSLSDGSNAINASQLEITCGIDPSIDTYTITPTSGTLSEFYVVLPASINFTYKFKATTSTGVNYYCTHSGITLEAGMFYRSTLTVSKLAGSISYAETNVQKNYGDGAFTHPLTNTGDGVVTYESTNTAVAEVDENGSVTIKGIGSTTIKATVADSNDYTYATNTAEYTLTVKYSGTGNLAPMDNPENL